LQEVQSGDEKLNLEAVQIAMLFHGYADVAVIEVIEGAASKAKILRPAIAAVLAAHDVAIYEFLLHQAVQALIHVPHPPFGMSDKSGAGINEAFGVHGYLAEARGAAIFKSRNLPLDSALASKARQ